MYNIDIEIGQTRWPWHGTGGLTPWVPKYGKYHLSVVFAWVPKYGNYRPHTKFQISLPLVIHHDESKSALTARYVILLLYLGHHNGITWQTIQEAFSGCSCRNSSVSQSEAESVTVNCGN
jgi:hypothetical protein